MPNILHQLVLASASPRRSELLNAMGVEFNVEATSIDESQNVQEPPRDFVSRLALEKAKALVEQKNLSKDNLAILAADTIVCQDVTVFGKPKDKSHAFEIWRQLSDTQHQVLTAVCLITSDNVTSCLVTTSVEFVKIKEQQMHNYWQSGEPIDKAGAYAIQGLASAWVKLIHGSYSNVVGLPLLETNKLLTQVGHNWL